MYVYLFIFILKTIVLYYMKMTFSIITLLLIVYDQYDY